MNNNNIIRALCDHKSFQCQLFEISDGAYSTVELWVCPNCMQVCNIETLFRYQKQQNIIDGKLPGTVKFLKNWIDG